MVRAFILALLAAVSVGDQYDSLLTNTLGWDDIYTTVIFRDHQRLSAEKLERLLDGTYYCAGHEAGWPELRRAVLGGIDSTVVSSVRVQRQNLTWGGGRVVWLVETRSSIQMYSLRDGSVAACRVAEGDYRRLWVELEKHGIWTLQTDAAPQAEDFSYFYISAMTRRQSHQVVVYAPPPPGQSPADWGVSESTKNVIPITMLVEAVRCEPEVQGRDARNGPQDASDATLNAPVDRH